MTDTFTFTLHLLTYQPEPMIAWWAALLETTPRQRHPRTTTLATPTLTLVIERSDIALDFHREACGVTTIDIAPPTTTAAIAAIDRLDALGAKPHRATRHPGRIRLWYHDPNGADVVIETPSDGSEADSDDPLFPAELDPDDVVIALRRQVTT